MYMLYYKVGTIKTLYSFFFCVKTLFLIGKENELVISESLIPWYHNNNYFDNWDTSYYNKHLVCYYNKHLVCPKQSKAWKLCVAGERYKQSKMLTLVVASS